MMFVDYVFAKGPLPPMPEGLLYQYVVGANGVFVRSWRPGLSAMIPVSECIEVSNNIRGLVTLLPYIHLERAVPLSITARMFELAYRAGNKEILFYLSDAARETGRPWRLFLPPQKQSGGSVAPIDSFAGGADTMIEVHSHHRMDAFFSGMDDQEEKTGFRIYAVIGGLGNKRPQMRARVGIYGHFCEFPAELAFCLPDGLIQTFMNTGVGAGYGD